MQEGNNMESIDPQSGVAENRDNDDVAETFGPVFDKIASHLSNEHGSRIRAVYDLGSALCRGYVAATKAAVENGCRLNRAGFLRLTQRELARRGHVDLPQIWLDACMRVAQSLRRAEINDLARKGTFTPSHVFSLAEVWDPDRRRELAERIQTQRLSADQVRHLLVEMYGRPARASRQVNQPQDLLLSLEKVQVDTARWTRAIANSCFGRSDWIRAIGMWPDDPCLDEMCYQMTASADVLLGMAENAANLAAKMYDTANDHRTAGSISP
jgi:hypothetical protein